MPAAARRGEKLAFVIALMHEVSWTNAASLKEVRRVLPV
jgi:hypothetical protein